MGRVSHVLKVYRDNQCRVQSIYRINILYSSSFSTSILGGTFLLWMHDEASSIWLSIVLEPRSLFSAVIAVL